MKFHFTCRLRSVNIANHRNFFVQENLTYAIFEIREIYSFKKFIGKASSGISLQTTLAGDNLTFSQLWKPGANMESQERPPQPQQSHAEY